MYKALMSVRGILYADGQSANNLLGLPYNVHLIKIYQSVTG